MDVWIQVGGSVLVALLALVGTYLSNRKSSAIIELKVSMIEKEIQKQEKKIGEVEEKAYKLEEKHAINEASIKNLDRRVESLEKAV